VEVDESTVGRKRKWEIAKGQKRKEGKGGKKKKRGIKDSMAFIKKEFYRGHEPQPWSFPGTQRLERRSNERASETRRVT